MQGESEDDTWGSQEIVVFGGFGVRGLGFGFLVSGFGFRVLGFGCQGSAFRVGPECRAPLDVFVQIPIGRQGSGFRVQGSGYRVHGSGFRVQVSGSIFKYEDLGQLGQDESASE